MAIMVTKNIAMALNTMRASRSRTVLTMLGVIIAVAAITTMVSIGNGVKQDVVHRANQYSKDVVTVRPSSVTVGRHGLGAAADSAHLGQLTPKDVTAVSNLDHVTAAVPMSVIATHAEGDHAFDGVVVAAGTDVADVISQDLTYGAYFSSKQSNNNIAVLGANAADKMFDERAPLGRSFTVRGQQFVVGGVLSKFVDTPFVSETNFNDAIIVPAGIAPSVAPNGSSVFEILAKVDNHRNLDSTAQAITKTIAKTHSGQRDFVALTPDQLAAESTEGFGLLTALIVAAAIITLLVSGVGIMNVMLVSVTERIHEIGIRKAVGATNRQILTQFMTEAAVLSLFGSLIGAFVALCTCVLLHLFTSLTPQYDWRVAGLASVAACLFGMMFGSLPALKAARKDPIQALRSE